MTHIPTWLLALNRCVSCSHPVLESPCVCVVCDRQQSEKQAPTRHCDAHPIPSYLFPSCLSAAVRPASLLQRRPLPLPQALALPLPWACLVYLTYLPDLICFSSSLPFCTPVQQWPLHAPTLGSFSGYFRSLACSSPGYPHSSCPLPLQVFTQSHLLREAFGLSIPTHFLSLFPAFPH